MDRELTALLDRIAARASELHGRDFLLTWQKSQDDLRTVLDVAEVLRLLRADGISTRCFDSGLAVSQFRDNSTRTRFSFASAANLLGLAVQDLDEGKSQIAHGETMRETAVMISFLSDVIGIRDDMYLGAGHAYMREVGEALDAAFAAGVLPQRPPVVNLQCDLDHPTQSMADLLHLVHEFGSLEALRGKTLAMTWAYSASYGKPLSVPQGVIALMTRFGMNVVLAHPEGYDLVPETLAIAERHAAESGGTLPPRREHGRGLRWRRRRLPQELGPVRRHGPPHRVAARPRHGRPRVAREGVPRPQRRPRRLAVRPRVDGPHAGRQRALPALPARGHHRRVLPARRGRGRRLRAVPRSPVPPGGLQALRHRGDDALRLRRRSGRRAARPGAATDAATAMNDDLRPLSFPRLIDWIRRERDGQGTLFGLHRDLCLWSLAGKPYATRRHGRLLEAPLGVAAGPHTQLSQNIVAAWACGARVFELKTVQIRDDLAIPRPCIDMTDEGYNCEWSQELPIDASFAQYADAWVAIRLLQREMGVYDPAEPGFLFDASVGYNLAGIRGAKVQRYLDRLANPGPEIAARLAAIGSRDDIAIPAQLAPSVTLSTMHGCPPAEIERIGRHLIADRGLHTAIKLNPTLLGAREVRELIGETLGYRVEIPDDVFAHDLAFADAVDILHALRDEAQRAGVGFGVKLTNTLACRNLRGVLPAGEPVVYLSGRALHPLAVRTALRLQEAFAGSLEVSFAGGVDAGNVARVLACGLSPVTVCSDLLRPGGYLRLRQCLEGIEASGPAPAGAAALANLRSYAQDAAMDPAYHRATYPDRSIRTGRALGAFDCIAAPCVWTCPTGQDVPEYLHHAARGDHRAALAVILRDNPFPTVTGMACDHPCEQKCTRVNLDAVVGIRDVKRYLAHAAEEPPAPHAGRPDRPSRRRDRRRPRGPGLRLHARPRRRGRHGV